MRTVTFASYLYSEKYSVALLNEQGLDFVYSYKVREKQMTVCEIDSCMQ